MVSLDFEEELLFLTYYECLKNLSTGTFSWSMAYLAGLRVFYAVKNIGPKHTK